MTKKISLVLCFYGFSGLFLPWLTNACPILVYEAAAKQWTPTEYFAVIEYQDDLANVSEQARTLLNRGGINQDKRANVTTTFLKAEETKRKDLPYMQVFYSENIERTNRVWVKIGESSNYVDYVESGIKTNVIWRGKLKKEDIMQMLDSPVRQEIKLRLSNGEVAVWLFIDSGITDKDQEAFNVVENTLNAVRKTMKIPSATNEVEKMISTSVIRLAHTDEKERFLLGLLKHFIGTDQESDTPLVIAVVGKGLLLKPLSGTQLKPESIQKIMASLLTNCTCSWALENKAQNLLMDCGSTAPNATP